MQDNQMPNSAGVPAQPDADLGQTPPDVAPVAAPAPVSSGPGFVQQPPPPQSADNTFWTKFIIFFNPLASIIVFLLKRDNEPELARRALGTGWFAVVFWTIVGFVVFVLYFVILFFSFFITFAALGSLGGSSGGW